MTYGVTGMTAAVLIGLAGLAYLPEPLDNPENVFIALVDAIAHPWVAGVILVGVLAAVMSTASSQLLVVASAVSEDVYRRFFNRSASGTHLLWAGRLIVVLVAVVAGALALSGGSVLGLVSYAWAGFGAAFGTVLLVSLFWRNMNRVGAIAGMIGGGATVVIYRQVDSIDLYEMIPGVLAALVCIVVFNRLGTRPTPAMLSDFDRVAQK